jgi:hypothetical protein
MSSGTNQNDISAIELNYKSYYCFWGCLKDGMTALLWAAMCARLAAVDQLLQFGAAVNTQDQVQLAILVLMVYFIMRLV